MLTVFLGSAKRFALQAASMTLAGLSFSAFAFQPLITDDTGTQGSGGNQLEFSYNEDRAKTAGNIERLYILPLVYTRGLTESLDVFAGFSYARVRSNTADGNASGGGNPSFGAKWRFYENEASGSSLAVKPEIVFPVSAERENSGLGTGKTSGKLTFILTQTRPFGALHVNAGLGRDRFRDGLSNPDSTTSRFSLAPVWDVSEQWKLAVDLGVESARAAGSTLRSNFVELGAIYSPGKDLDFAIGILRSSDNDSPRTTTNTANAGITWRFR
ncbi:transporter [Propionivibrio sp.]|uniref:transporter n=1 Tax=Propionivibrio sp. TaxID=2212460 RepID=UPI00262A1838|nr:transporter [Propionivibrio sp.]